MQNNKILTNFDILQNKYFLVLCFYLKKNLNTNYIVNSLFIGYKYNYLLLNINVFLKTLKNILYLINNISNKNGNILMLYTKNKILNYILLKNSIKNKVNYLSNFNTKQVNLISYFSYLPDLIISFDYPTNAIFLNKISKYNIPVICITNSLNNNIIKNMMYYLILNNKSLYSNLILIYIIFNSIYINQNELGTKFLYKKSN